MENTFYAWAKKYKNMIVLTLKKNSILENQNTMALFTIPNAQLTFEKFHEYLVEVGLRPQNVIWIFRALCGII